MIAEPAAALDRDREVLLVWTGEQELPGVKGTRPRVTDDEGEPSTPAGEAPVTEAGAAEPTHVADARSTP